MARNEGTATRAVRRLEQGEPGFPPELAALRSAPKAIYICGEIPPPPRVAIIGSRRADQYGLDLARSIAAELARAGVCVVNGGAAGIDSQALQAALETGGRPLAVLGTGCHLSYPSSNRRLFDRIAEKGALLSELEPDAPGLPASFSARNRLISAMAEAVLVVRAAEKSGSLVAARYAVEQGRRLMALPGPAGEELSRGCHRLIRAGALLVESAADVLEAIGRKRSAQQKLPGCEPAGDELDGEENAVLQVVRQGAASIDQVGERSGLGSALAAAALLRLELKGWVERRPGMLYLACSGGGRPRPA